MNPQTDLTAAELDTQLTQPTAAATLEAAALRSTLADLRNSSMAAADFRLLAPRPNARPSHAFVPRWAMIAATAAMAVAVAVPVAIRHAHLESPTTIAVGHAAQPVATDTTVQDDALLADIQEDLSASVPASLQPLATTSTSSIPSTK